MSESPKMGLFGSKDETKETKKETKDDSPDRYAPYCIDSDSETYDTEALSIMDINDIIGVQSEPVSDSTLESEIAALSQMITESKTDASQNVIEKNSREEEEVTRDDKTYVMENTSETNKHLKSIVEESEQAISKNVTQSSKENLQSKNENNLEEGLQSCEQQGDNDRRDNSESVFIDSIASVNTKDVENSNVNNEMTMKSIQCANDSISVTSKTVKDEEDGNRYSMSKQEDSNIKVTAVNSEVTVVENENSIRGSLQLIGEAYSSEDSQEAMLNDEEPKEPNSPPSSNEHCLITSEERKDADEVCESQDVNNVSEKVDNVSLGKDSIDKNIEVVENERVYNIEIDTSNSCTGPTVMEELPIILEETKDVSAENKVDSPSNKVMQCEEEIVNTEITHTNNTEGILDEKKVHIQVEKVMSQHEECLEMIIDEKVNEPMDDTNMIKGEKSQKKIEEKSLETGGDQDTTESMIIEEKEEQSSKNDKRVNEEEAVNQVKEDCINISNTGDNAIDNQMINIEENDKINKDNDIEVTKEKNETKEPIVLEIQSEIGGKKDEIKKPIMFEVQLEVAEEKNDTEDYATPIVQLECIENPIADNLGKVDSPQVVDNLEVSKDESSEVELQEVKEEMVVEKLETETELQQNTLEPIIKQLSPKIDDQISVIPEETSISVVQDSTESPSDDVNLIDNGTDIVDNTEVNAEVANEEKKLDSMSSEVISAVIQDVNVESEMPIVQEKLEEQTKIETLESFDMVDKCEVSMEVDLNEHCIDSVLKEDITSMDINMTEDNPQNKVDQPMEGTTDKVIEKMEANVTEAAEVKTCIPEENQESTEVQSLVVKEAEPEETSSLVDDFKESAEPRDTEIPENSKIEEVTEREVIIEKQVEEKEILEEQTEEEKGIQEKTEEEKIAEKQIEEEKRIQEVAQKEEIVEKQVDEEKTIQEETEKEDIMKKQLEEESRTQAEEDGKEISSEVIIATKQPTEIISEIDESQDLKDIYNVVKENHPERSEENVTQKEVDVNIEEVQGFTEVIVPEEDAKEEHMEEEMNLTLELEETESQPDVVKSDAEEKSENEKDAELIEKIIKENPEESIVKMDDNEELVVEKSSTVEVNSSEVTEESELNRNEKILDRQQLENNGSKNDNNKDTLKDVLETANNVEEIFSEEQCQNTQDIVTSILDDVRAATDFKNILSTEASITNEMEEVLQQSTEQSKNLPLAEPDVEELAEKLPQDSEETLHKDMEEETISMQNMDSLEGLLDLDLMPEEKDSSSALKEAAKTEEGLQKSEQLDMSEPSNDISDQVQSANFITDVIDSCLADKDSVPLEEDNTENTEAIEAEDDKSKEVETSDILKEEESIITEPVDSKDNNEENLEKDLSENATELQDNELEMEFEEAQLESIGELEEAESKLEMASDILLDNVDQGENLNDASVGIETSQPSSEISELESAVKFLQESEEQAMDSPLVLSPKMVESVVDDISKQTVASSLFVPDEDLCENTSELEAELQNIVTDSIAISEAEIISEAAKLESERKLAEQIKIDAMQEKLAMEDDKEVTSDNVIEEKLIAVESSEAKFDVAALENVEIQKAAPLKSERIAESKTIVTLPQNILKISDSIPKVSILEERLKEPPKIEIPITDVTKISMSPTASKDSLLIQKDAKLIAYQKMLESPKLSERSEPKSVETPRKDSEKHDFENVGSPRIILKIAKSAITDCGEPRSPKSPKIRSATNSPNPEDSPGQKLGKIKLKLSKGGHPSIISNENIEDVGQWYSEGSSSLSPIGMKIKLSKTGDASIVSSEKHESTDDPKEGKHKFEEAKRTESPIGMKIKLSKSGDASIVQDSKEMQMKHKDKLDMMQGSPKRTESPIGMKIKLLRTGDASIIQPERQDLPEEHKDNSQMKSKEKLESSYDSPKRTDSPIGMKIKFSKTGDASIVSPDLPEESKEVCKAREKLESTPEMPKRTESPIGMKIKLAKTKGGASIISMENSEEPKDKLEMSDVPKRTESPLGMKIKLSKTGDASIVHSEVLDEAKEKVEVAHDATKSLELSCGMKIKVTKSGEAPQMETIAQESEERPGETVQVEPLPKVEGMKIKLSKFGDASIIPSEKQEQSEEGKLLQEVPKRTESPLGMKIKLSKTGDASIIQPEYSEDTNKMVRTTEAEHSKVSDASLGMKIKLLKTGDASIVDSEKKEKQRRRDTESPLEMKIKLSKTGHPTIVACDNQQQEAGHKSKESVDSPQNLSQRYKEAGLAGKEPALKILKTGHPNILHSNRAELTIEPVQMQGKKPESVVEIPPKRKDLTIAPIESKKSKLEAQFTQMLPEVTIQPVTSREQKQFLFDPKNSAISLQQMNVINQEISITQVRPQKPPDPSMSEKLKDILSKTTSASSMNSDCEIIEHRPELIIVNENSNSSQDVVIIEEVPPNRMPEVKVPKKRGRPRRNPLPQGITHPVPHMLVPRDPLSLDDVHQMQQPQVPHFPESRENERPKRTCRSQKSYAPPKRGRGRGRGKRKLDNVDPQLSKKPRIEQDLSAIEASTTAVITIDDSGAQQESMSKASELYKVLKQPTADSKAVSSLSKADKKLIGQKNDGTHGTPVRNSEKSMINNTLSDCTALQAESNKTPAEMRPLKSLSNDIKDNKKSVEIVSEKLQKSSAKVDSENKSDNTKPENKDMLVPPGHPNWLTPTSKRAAENATKHENVSTVQVIDEETRMSAESGSRSQTPARNISAQAPDTIVNEESQGSVLSTATTESEKVKVKNRRMEINFDPDEGPFTVDKIAEYEWPLDRKGETFMIQEQISQYLGVKSFKRKYPDLKRRVVDMEERNYLRENGLVSEAMCDMGLTAICSSEVLDVMCSDFPDQYEEYRKHMREKQVKEHSKKQKELTAAANAEKNRIDLAEMAVQSALSWNINLNKDRRENRKCSLDLQTFTIHVPKKQQKVESERKIGHYPVALIPGQYTDYYREYTPAELRYYPLNTVLYGPMRPNERKFDSQSEGSQSDSDSDSSSDDSSSSSSEGTQNTEDSQSTMDEVDIEITNQKEEVKLKCKMCLKTLNKHNKNEVLIQCGTCNGHVHPSCIDLTLDMVPHIQSYAWQCTDCKTCAQCHDPADEDKMLFCDMCDRGYHIYCVGLRRVPQGRWHCQECAVCANCGSREPGGINSDRNSVAQWQHEYKKGDKNTRVYVSTLCVPCSKLWRKGRYCPHCSRCHTAQRLDLEANLVHCSACDKYLHLGCVETKGILLDRKNYLCDFCAPNRQHTMKPLISKTLKT